MKAENLSAKETDDIINRHSGLLGVSGISNDCREILEEEANGNKRASLAINMLVAEVKKIIGSYLAEMNGADAIVFTAGIGENAPAIRSRICRDMDFFGIKIDEEKNLTAKRGETVDITASEGTMKVFVIPTDEEYMIAKDTLNLVK